MERSDHLFWLVVAGSRSHSLARGCRRDRAIGTCLGISVTPRLDCRMAPWPKQQTAVAMRQMGDELDGPQRGSQSVEREDMWQNPHLLDQCS